MKAPRSIKNSPIKPFSSGRPIEARVASIKKAAKIGITLATGLILGAVYMLWAYQRVMFGPLDKLQNKSLLDLNLREVGLMFPIAILIVLMGVYPKPFLSKIEPTVDKLISENFKDITNKGEIRFNPIKFVKF